MLQNHMQGLRFYIHQYNVGFLFSLLQKNPVHFHYMKQGYLVQNQQFYPILLLQQFFLPKFLQKVQHLLSLFLSKPLSFHQPCILQLVVEYRNYQSVCGHLFLFPGCKKLEGFQIHVLKALDQVQYLLLQEYFLQW